MDPLDQCPENTLKGITTIFTDIDDTLTTDGQLPASAYTAIEQLTTAGVQVVPVTDRPGGWCDMIARFWPVRGVIGENGAFYFSYNRGKRRMIRSYWQTEDERHSNRQKLLKLQADILTAVPKAAISADQAYRVSDLAIDFCEDVPPLSQTDIDTIVKLFEEAGAVAKVSSIHVNGWFGAFDKMAMTRRFVQDMGLGDFETSNGNYIFVGDSPNDAPMFAAFRHSVGVANILTFEKAIQHLPSYVTKQKGGDGFSEVAHRILQARAN